MSDDNIVKWPSWRYGPDGQEAIFQSEDEVPEGWEDHPSKIGKSAKSVDDDDKTADGYEEFSEADLITELKGRKAEFSEKWGKPRLIAALRKLDKEAK
jgi:hypothetical protein